MNTTEYIVFFFAILAIYFIIAYIFIPDKKFLEPLENKNAKSADSMMLWGIIPIGTLFLGSRRLDKEQLEYYGLTPDINYEQIIPGYLPRFRTKFLALFIPLIPLRTQIIFNEENKGIFFREGKFYAIPVKMYWKQVYSILSCSYSLILLIIIVIYILIK